MDISFSKFGAKLGGPCGIQELMDDLGTALTGQPDMRMMGGGNPAHIPAVQAVWRQHMADMLADGGAFDRMLANYDPPRGNPAFLKALAGFLNAECGWDITAEHLAVTPGGQTAFFFLFNMLAGEQPDGKRKKILLPLTPEYIGYENQGLEPDLFVACAPLIEGTGPHEFKYRVDFAAVSAAFQEHAIAAVCVSRPTNPTGNVLTDEEIHQLDELARANGVPLLVDNAYGLPFPGAIFVEAKPVWNETMILGFSLSKLGLPGTRTGIVVAPPPIAKAIAAMTSVVGLANTNLGQALALPLLQSGEMSRVSRELIRPFYEERSLLARQWIESAFGSGFPYAWHKSEGAFFLWLHFPDLPIPTRELYQRLKARKVLIVPGEYFFFGLADDDWPHRRQCLRMTFSQAPAIVQDGIGIIADVVRGL
ncbi:MAG: valine--pyruvate transaminase [Verrucomicrobiales bacterium]|nr:valine--pyruvate transaminase [Verrucomicrobiales bacterium]